MRSHQRPFSASLPRESHCARCWAPLPALALLRSPINQRHPTHQRSRPPRSTWWRRSTSGGLWRSRSAACTSKSPRFCPPQQRTPTRSNRRPLLSTPAEGTGRRVQRSGIRLLGHKNLERDTVSVSAAQMVGAVEGDNPHLWFSSDARNAMAKELADTYSRIMPKQRNTSQTNSRRGTDARR